MISRWKVRDRALRRQVHCRVPLAERQENCFEFQLIHAGSRITDLYFETTIVVYAATDINATVLWREYLRMHPPTQVRRQFETSYALYSRAGGHPVDPLRGYHAYVPQVM